jgi:hypothetical protein
MYVNDFDQNGTVEHIITRYDNGTPLPFVLRPELVGQIPSLKKKYLHFESLKGQGFNDMFSEEQRKGTIRLEVNAMESVVLINDGGRKFRSQPLPAAAQFTPVYAILAEDFNADGAVDVLVGGNQRRAKPETGIYDASYGALFFGDHVDNLNPVSQAGSGLHLTGEVRAFRRITVGQRRAILVARSNDKLEILFYGSR